MINNFWDLLVVFIYLSFVLCIAFYYGKQKRGHRNDLKEQYLAGGTLSFWESLSSILATETSALTFLGIPSVALSGNFSFLQIYIGAIFGRFFIAKFLLPHLYHKQLTAYSSLTSNRSKSFMASIFIISKILSVGVRLYSGSILLALFFGLSPIMAVIITLALTFFYTLFGGLKAVVRTDMVQMALFLTGGIVAHFLIPSVADQTWSHLISEAFANGKLSLTMNSGSYWGYFIGVIAGFLFDIATHGTDQDFMQRLLASKTLRQAQLSIFFSAFASIMTASIFLGVGALMWSYSQTNPFPAHITPDKSFAYFITEFFPVGFKGLMLAGILAATMSTVDSTVNAICACLHCDIFTTRKKALHFYVFRDTLFVSLILLVIAILASKSQQILSLGLTVQSWSAGAMLCFFSAFLWFKRSPSPKILFFMLIASISGVAINTFVLKGTWHWNTYWGFGLGSLFYISYLLFTKKQNLSKA